MSDFTGIEALSPFDRKQWEEIQAWEQGKEKKRVALPQKVEKVAQRTGDVATTVRKKVRDLPGADQLETAIKDAVSGWLESVTKVGDSSLNRKGVFKAYAKHGYHLDDLEDILNLELKAILKVKPRLDLRYSTAGAAEGAATGFVASGGSVAAISGSGIAGVGALPGAGILITSTIGDVLSVLALSARVVAETAAYYGYDSKLPDEELFAAGVLGTALNGADGAQKQAALLAMNKLMGDIARRKTWNQLNKQVITRLIQQIYKALSIQLTQKKLAQAVPMLGIAISSGMNMKMLNRVAETADHLYRRRFLVEKYGLYEIGSEHEDERIEVVDEFNKVIQTLSAETSEETENS